MYTYGMKNETAQKILEILKVDKRQTPKQIATILQISTQALHRQLLKLQAKKLIQKIGLPPKVYYELAPPDLAVTTKEEITLSVKQRALLKDFILITSDGQYYKHHAAFKKWCQNQNLSVEKTLEEYATTRAKYDAFKINGYINGMPKLIHTFPNSIYIDALYYLDFYSIERFGKTRLGQLMLYAKQSQNKDLMFELIQSITPKLNQFIKEQAIDALCFVPPTVKRSVQFMQVFASQYASILPKVSLQKIKTPIIVPQKTISKLADRIVNAQATFYAHNQSNSYKRLLLIDDAVGSGATMNTCAKILKEANVCQTVVGLGITGSFKGFEILNEV